MPVKFLLNNHKKVLAYMRIRRYYVHVGNGADNNIKGCNMYLHKFDSEELETQGSVTVDSDGMVRICATLNKLGAAVELEPKPDCYLVSMVVACWDFVDIIGFDSEQYRIASPGGIANYLSTALPMIEFTEEAIAQLNIVAADVWLEPSETREHIRELVSEYDAS